MQKDLGEPIRVPFEKLFLDPNNPRIAPEERPGYEDPDSIFDETVQNRLTDALEQVYDVDPLRDAIVAQGWVPIDAILVWEHHKGRDHHIVVEGNTRTIVLRRIRSMMLPAAEQKLKRMQKRKNAFSKLDLEQQERLVERLREIVADTDVLTVYPVNATKPEELEKILPRLLGVRHVTSAQGWKPFAKNLYILTLYERAYRQKYGEGSDLALEDELIRRVGDMVSTGPTKTRRNIQAASAFSRFRRDYEDKLSEGDEFRPDDQYYLENILVNKYAQQEFDFDRSALFLPPEMEEVLFKWAFRYPRVEAEESENILRRAEDIRLWARIKRYDDKKGTSFASELAVQDPDNATPMAKLEAKYRAHMARRTPLDTVEELLSSFEDMHAETLRTQASHLKPLFQKLVETATEYINMIDAVDTGTAAPASPKKKGAKKKRKKRRP